MKNKAPIYWVIALLQTYHALGGWVTSIINDSYYYGQNGVTAIQIGAGRNDGVQRLYAAVTSNNGPYDGNLSELSYSSGTWNNVQVETYGPLHYNSIAVGVGRYDNVTRVYAATSSGIREYTWSAGTYAINIFGDSSSPFLTLADIENTGIHKIYDWNYSSGSEYLKEWAYAFGNFTGTNLTSVAASLNSGTIGIGRNDGIQRIYGVGSSGNLCEYSFANGAWTSNNVVIIPAVLNSVAIGAGRNEGVQRIYVACQDAHIYELTYNSGTWVLTDVGYGGQSMNCVTVGPGQNDGNVRVYAGNSDHHLYEFTFKAGAWTKADLGAGGGIVRCITIGNGRNDGVNRVYAGNSDFNIYEYSYSPSGTNLPPYITKFSNGSLTWTNSQTNVLCYIQWSPNLTSTNWNQDWSALTAIKMTNTTMTVQVPMFYRVMIRTNN